MMCIFSACSDHGVIMLGEFGKMLCRLRKLFRNIKEICFTLSSNQKIESKYLIANPFGFEIGPRGTKRYVRKIHLENVNPRGVYLPEPKANTKCVSMLDT